MNNNLIYNYVNLGKYIILVKKIKNKIKSLKIDQNNFKEVQN